MTKTTIGKDAAREVDELINDHIHLARAAAKLYPHPKETQDEAEQEAFLGLAVAAMNYVKSKPKGVGFDAYARGRIAKHMNRPARTKRPRLDPTRRLTAKEEVELARRIRAGDQEARRELVEANLAFAWHVAKRYRSAGMELDDMAQEGIFGLIHAADLFNPDEHPTRFATYAAFWIRHHILRALCRDFSLIRIPDYLFRRRTLYLREEPAIREMGLVGEEADAEMARRLKISPKQLRRTVAAMTTQSETPIPTHKDGEEKGHDEAFTDPYRPDLEWERAEDLAQLAASLEQLAPIERWILCRRYGLAIDGEPEGEGMSLAAIGRACKLCKQRVHQIEQTALEKLKSLCEAV